MTTPPDKHSPEAQADLWVAVRLMAEGSDWKRDQGETLTAWAQRTLSKARSASAPRMQIPLKVRPMLVRGMLAYDERGPVILINSEEADPKEQVVSLWHETLHLIGMTDEFLTEEYAMRLADACPDILRRLAHNINVPDSKPPSHEQRMEGDNIETHSLMLELCHQLGAVDGEGMVDMLFAAVKDAKRYRGLRSGAVGMRALGAAQVVGEALDHACDRALNPNNSSDSDATQSADGKNLTTVRAASSAPSSTAPRNDVNAEAIAVLTQRAGGELFIPNGPDIEIGTTYAKVEEDGVRFMFRPLEAQ
jgi:hypothetical protein